MARVCQFTESDVMGAAILVKNVQSVFNNGGVDAPGVVTRVWHTVQPGVWMVNFRIIPDSSDVPIWCTSRYVYENEEVAQKIAMHGAAEYGILDW